MTRRERLEAKAAKRTEWAAKAEGRAARRFAAADPSEAATGIPFGQPILVGHHSERRHRAAVDRIARNMSKGIEESDLAQHHARCADGLAAQLETSIYSDDHDAVERLDERRTELEQERDWMKSANAHYKKHKSLDTWEGPERMKRDGLSTMRVQAYYGCPFPPYSLTNIGARIRAAKKRAEWIPKENARREERQAKAEAAGGCVIEYTETGDYCAVTFADKPAREILNALRAAFYCWSGGSWSGPVSRLPASVAALAAPPEAPSTEAVAGSSPVSPLSGDGAGEATAEGAPALDLFQMTDQPETCRRCGARTEFTDGPPQVHTCPRCAYTYLVTT